MSGSIRLSPKHGVNPTIPLCFYCLQEKNELILAGRLKGEDKEAPKNTVWDKNPCDQCKDYMSKGIIFIEVKEAPKSFAGQDTENPYRAGGWMVVSENFVNRVVTTESLRKDILKKRSAFIPTEVWHALGLHEVPPTALPPPPQNTPSKAP